MRRSLIIAVFGLVTVSAPVIGCRRGAEAPRADAATTASGPTVQPGAPGEATKDVPSPAAATAPAVNATDVRFMQGMILHHAQAMEMVELLKTRTERDDMRLFAKKIEVSQNDELKMMRTWLIDRHQPAPSQGAGHGQLMMISGEPMAAMPGMLTEQQMKALTAAKGAAFDKLFLAGMIQHHEGALKMVADLFSTDGAAQDSMIFDFASHVDSDQRMDISRMRRMLTK